MPAEVVVAAAAGVWEGGGGWGDSGPSPGEEEKIEKLLASFVSSI